MLDKQYAIRNTRYAIRNTRYAIRNMQYWILDTEDRREKFKGEKIRAGTTIHSFLTYPPNGVNRCELVLSEVERIRVSSSSV